MSAVLDALAQHARGRPDEQAVVGGGVALSYAELIAEIHRAAEILDERGPGVLALALDNAPIWAVWDLAAQQAGVTLVPLPDFFTPEQSRHALEDAGVEVLIRPAEGDDDDLQLAGQTCRWEPLYPARRNRVPAGTAKITYTSGTTGKPKGVCLAQSAIDRVVRSLAEAAQASSADRHLALLPLSVLLENIGGLYIPLLVGATAVLEPMSRVGLSGSSGLEPQTMLRALREARATTAISVPAQLNAMVATLESGKPAPAHLRFLAVGGGAVATRLLERAHASGLPAYQGYGLSECASVVTVNRPGDDGPDTVGRPLPHTKVKIAEDGEVEVRAPGFLGYLGGGDTPREKWWPTGDLGRLDADGRLHILGRKKNIFITAFGRNVAPEWVEAELTAEPAIAQSAVFGEARPWNSAVLVTTAPDHEVFAAIDRANRRLPDYARVYRWLRADSPFSSSNGQATDNGRLRRAAVLSAYSERLNSLYDTQEVAQ